MARKTLKQKLKSQLRYAKEQADLEFELAGRTLNFELQRMQAIALAHGLMATLAEARTVLGDSSEDLKKIEGTTQIRISQCVSALVAMGMDIPEINKRITQGS